MSRVRSLRPASILMGVLLGIAIAGVGEGAASGASAPYRATAPDSSLGDFLKNLSDSTDRYFGSATAPLDTAGLDSALIYGLEHPDEEPKPRALRIGGLPSFSFNRVDGPTYGGVATLGNARRFGELFGDVGYAVGPNDWLGGGGYRVVMRQNRSTWTLRLSGGSNTISMGREQTDRHLTSFRALISGADHRSYLRQEGAEARLTRETEDWRVGLAYRSMVDAPLATTTTWTLTGREISLVENLAAAPGRTAELEVATTWRVPSLPVTAEFVHHFGDEALGGDFDFRRYRASLAGTFGVSRFATLVPQLLYGRLHGDAVPQNSFYLGGTRTLRSLPGSSRGGTGIAVARFDLIGANDILALAHIPHPDAVPIQAGLFAATGAAWGKDPFGGPTNRGIDWPGRENWASEVGLSLIYQPGIPDPTSLIRFNYAWALGPGRDTESWTLSFTRALDLVRPLGGN